MVSSNKEVFRLPVSRVKALKPLGHSGHRRLQAVVGSMDKLTGLPQCMGFFKILLM
jgi:hypothetical protein